MKANSAASERATKSGPANSVDAVLAALIGKQFEEQGTEPASSTQAEMAKILRDEYVRLGMLAKSLGLSVN